MSALVVSLGQALTLRVVAYYKAPTERELNAILTKAFPHLKGFVYKQCRNFTEDQRMEFLQEGLIKITTGLRKEKFDVRFAEGDVPLSFFTWACRIINNVVVDFTRRKADPSQPNTDELLLGRVGEQLHEEEVNESNEYANTLLLLIREILKTFSPALQEVAESIFFQGYSYQETADYYRRPLGTVKAQANRIFVRLREELAKHGITKIDPSLYKGFNTLDTGDMFGDGIRHRRRRETLFKKRGIQDKHDRFATKGVSVLKPNTSTLEPPVKPIMNAANPAAEELEVATARYAQYLEARGTNPRNHWSALRTIGMGQAEYNRTMELAGPKKDKSLTKRKYTRKTEAPVFPPQPVVAGVPQMPRPVFEEEVTTTIAEAYTAPTPSTLVHTSSFGPITTEDVKAAIAQELGMAFLTGKKEAAEALTTLYRKLFA